MKTQPKKSPRGRTNITKTSKSTSRRWTANEKKTQAARPVKAGGGAKRGDRRDMNKAYTGTAKHRARGNSPRVNVATRKN